MYGSGVYLATDQATSNHPGYCGPGDIWPNSKLGDKQVKIMAVCEIVNRPEEFRGAPGFTSKFGGSYAGSCPRYVVQHVGESLSLLVSETVQH